MIAVASLPKTWDGISTLPECGVAADRRDPEFPAEEDQQEDERETARNDEHRQCDRTS